jgi:hypothetical protein
MSVRLCDSVRVCVWVRGACECVNEWRGEFNRMVSVVQLGLNLNSVNHLILLIVKCGVLFEVRTELLNNI